MNRFRHFSGWHSHCITPRRGCEDVHRTKYSAAMWIWFSAQTIWFDTNIEQSRECKKRVGNREKQIVTRKIHLFIFVLLYNFISFFDIEQANYGLHAHMSLDVCPLRVCTNCTLNFGINRFIHLLVHIYCATHNQRLRNLIPCSDRRPPFFSISWTVVQWCHFQFGFLHIHWIRIYFFFRLSFDTQTCMN